MKKDALQLLAAYGVRHKLALMERELRELHRDFPEAFASETPPVLLRPERKPNGNDWPAVTADDTVTASNGIPAGKRKNKGPGGKVWSAAHKRNYMATMRAKRDAAKWGTFGWQRVHDFLAKQPKRTAQASDLVTGAKLKTNSEVARAFHTRPDLIERLDVGTYRLKKVMEH